MKRLRTTLWLILAIYANTLPAEDTAPDPFNKITSDFLGRIGIQKTDGESTEEGLIRQFPEGKSETHVLSTLTKLILKNPNFQFYITKSSVRVTDTLKTNQINFGAIYACRDSDQFETIDLCFEFDDTGIQQGRPGLCWSGGFGLESLKTSLNMVEDIP